MGEELEKYKREHGGVIKSDSKVPVKVSQIEVYKRMKQEDSLPTIYNIIAFDTTSSMGAYRQAVRENIGTLSNELLIGKYDEIHVPTQILVVGAGEYLDAPNTLQIKQYTDNPHALKKMLEEIADTGGGSPCQVSFELLFQELNNRDKRLIIPGGKTVLTLISDEITHGQDSTEGDWRADYRTELNALKQKLTGLYFLSASDLDAESSHVNLQRELVDYTSESEKFIHLASTVGVNNMKEVLTPLLIGIGKQIASKYVKQDLLAEYTKRLETSGKKEIANKVRLLLGPGGS